VTLSRGASVPEGATVGLCLVGAMLSDVGLVRSLNEDSVAFVVPPDSQDAKDRNGLVLVADGMGGHAAGEVASRLAVEIVRRCLFELQGDVAETLAVAFSAANKAIFDYGQAHPECAGMGTTCTALVVQSGRMWLGHVGDSRAYLLRGSKLKQLSEDQTLVAKMVRDGVMTPEEAKISEHSNIILQALGTAPDVCPDIWSDGIALLPGDTMIVCSDGLHGLVEDEVIADIAGRLAPQEACQELLQRALQAGGHDNVSVGVFRAIASAPERTSVTDTRRIPAMNSPDGGGSAERATRQLSAFERQQ
jgi:serine/threonine protein phosphatase PrpC